MNHSWNRTLRRTGWVAVGAVLATLTLGSVVVAGAARTGAEAAALPAHLPASRLSAPATDGRTVVAVVLGRSGTDAADALAPYDVFARSDRFSVYTVADTTAPVRLEGGLAVRPTFAFDDIATGAAAAPDVVVVPAVGDPAGPAERAARRWIAQRAAAGAQILGVCAGARTLAAAGVLDGHRATSHWSRIAELRNSRPAVRWVTGERWVEDGRITTTAGVTSGIPGALRVMQRLAGDAEAARVGREIGYPGWSLTEATTIPVQRFQVSDAGLALNLALPWFKPTIGLDLTDGRSEIDAVSAVEVYSYSSAARIVPLGSGRSITTAHGLVLGTVPRGTVALDRVIRAEGLPSAFADLAAHTTAATARSTAKMLEYPLDAVPPVLDGSDLRVPALLTAALALAVLAGLSPTLLGALRRRHRATDSSGGRSAREPDRAAFTPPAHPAPDMTNPKGQHR